MYISIFGIDNLFFFWSVFLVFWFFLNYFVIQNFVFVVLRVRHRPLRHCKTNILKNIKFSRAVDFILCDKLLVN